jgi:hypothetical protein
MVEGQDARRPKDPSTARVQCRRVHRKLTIQEHLVCPYCFGCAADVAWGDHANFCEFRPGIDPINFGFPDSYGQHLGL